MLRSRMLPSSIQEKIKLAGLNHGMFLHDTSLAQNIFQLLIQNTLHLLQLYKLQCLQKKAIFRGRTIANRIN